ncbi:MAG: hypothetical protein LRY55_12030 [Leadbetterella sp.]|nr:hypothetical protein [Leadbetterella sp.]
MASAVAGFSREVTDHRYNPYLRSEAVNPYLERYKEGIRNLYSFKRIIAGYSDNTGRAAESNAAVQAKAVAEAGMTDDGQCYSDVFKYCAGAEIEIEIEAEEGYQNYKWFKDNVEIAGATGRLYTITEPGSYHFTAEDPETCDAKLCCPYLVNAGTRV